MKKFWKRLGIRLGAIKSMLTSEFILISNIKRENPGAPEATTSWSAFYRTDNSDEHDFLVVKGEAIRKYKKLPPEVKAEQVL